jgi:hypothetical protein
MHAELELGAPLFAAIEAGLLEDHGSFEGAKLQLGPTRPGARNGKCVTFGGIRRQRDAFCRKLPLQVTSRSRII